jgi:Uma2 family endonuclease
VGQGNGADDALPDDLVLWRMSVKQYHAITRARILDEEQRVELLEGLLVQKMCDHPLHSVATQRVIRALTRLLPGGWIVRSQEAITFADSQPEPDAAVVRGEVKDYSRRLPGPHETALIVEVSDGTLHCDRSIKKRIYARARIPVYWVVNLIDRRLEVYTEPSGLTRQPTYRAQRSYGIGDEVPVWLGEDEIGRIPVQQLLPE